MLHTLTQINEEVLAQIEEEKAVRKTTELFLLFSFNSQFDHLILQKMESLRVYCLVADPARITATDVQKLNPKGIILSGGPASVHGEAVLFDRTILDIGTPVFGICLGFQLWTDHIGAKVIQAPKREFGVHEFKHTGTSLLFKNIPSSFKVLESHGDMIEPHNELTITGTTSNAPAASGEYKHLYGVQFHPEVSHTEFGDVLFENFIIEICNAKDRFPSHDVAERKIATIVSQIANKKVLIAISGGSDSSIVAYLLKKASERCKTEILGIYIQGIDRPDDARNVQKYFGNESWMKTKIIDATDRFVEALAGISIAREKRIAMRGIYKDVLEKEIKEFGADFIAQGTLYTDVSESGGGYESSARKAQIKLHHNVDLGFSAEELTPLIDCVKDNARSIGRDIGVPEELLVRHPFPGPGLLVRIEGEITKEKIEIARKADGIYIEELRSAGLYELIWQAGAVLTKSVTTCTKGDDATTGNLLVLWAVESINGFTAQAYDLPFDFIKKVSMRMTNEIKEIGRVAYAVSDKPPATIEWE